MVSKFTQPNYTAQSGTVYPLSIDASIAVLAEQAAQFAVSAQDTPNMTIVMRAGRIARADGTTLAVAAQNSATLSAPTTNPRKDIVYYDTTSGAIGVATGVEAASPVDPAVPEGKVSVARINWTVGALQITNFEIDDLRPLVLPTPIGRFQVFTSNGTFTAKISGSHLVIAIGGGGGGGGAGYGAAGPQAGEGGAGGGGGGIVVSTTTLVANTNYSAVIGGGGSAGSGGTPAPVQPTAGGNGGSTTFNGLTAPGGTGGLKGWPAAMSLGRGTQGATGGGYGGGVGGAGGDGAAGSNATAAGGYGGGGGGGGGGGASAGTAYAGGNGGAGSAGILIVLW